MLTLDVKPLDIKLVASRSLFTVFYAVLKMDQAVLSFVMFWLFEAIFKTVMSTSDLKEKNYIRKIRSMLI